ncbi:MAG: hypothetical protein MR842_09320 [Clostridiales bacterium]|nr:hypothetical protein [Clostridiales bacterium]MCI6377940.1 hypothetical protein [Clostridiales bacterium]MDO4351097.1 lipoate protein ligase C-terminal domain-containing protein [Eubacteriales bacterium]MDY4007532.1 lipoate protein ligase C-terminal domain-containing protein [Candidatus Limiplasma sp.]
MIRRTACLIARGGNPYRNQAIEKHLMDTLPEDTAILYLWQNEHSILIGRCQNPLYECKVDPFLASGGHIARRLGGGATAYHDAGVLNFTFLLPKTQFDIARQLGVAGMAVGAFGVQAQSGPHAILHAEGHMFGRNAFFKSGSAAMHHGALLVNCDLEQWARYLTGAQPASPGPADAPVNLNALCADITVDALQQALYWAFARVYGAQPAWLDEQMLDSRSIEGWTARFADPAWIYPEAIPYTFSISERFPWGGVMVKLNVEGGVIRAARIFTDAMEAPLFASLEAALTGSPFLISAIAGRFDQRLELMNDSRLMQLAGDVCNLICGRIRSLDRAGGAG